MVPGTSVGPTFWRRTVPTASQRCSGTASIPPFGRIKDFMSTPSITLVPAKLEDMDALANLRIEAMRESLQRIGRFDPARARARFTKAFNPAHTRHIELNGKRVGFLVVTRSEDSLSLDHLYLQPASQGMGIGAYVLGVIFKEADDEKLQVKVGALKQSDSNRFYIRHGFRLIEESEFDNYYTRPKAH